uniref:Secreted protein n=1 Tax=Heterorhabditis bacteriophora TaxID=37862 RepID=A0A1I7W8I2_HETBA
MLVSSFVQSTISVPLKPLLIVVCQQHLSVYDYFLIFRYLVGTCLRMWSRNEVSGNWLSSLFFVKAVISACWLTASSTSHSEPSKCLKIINSVIKYNTLKQEQ